MASTGPTRTAADPFGVDAAESLARSLVEPLGRRWDHVRAVAGRAVELSRKVPQLERSTLVVAAWLHDIGYSPRIGHARFHPLDGARFLRAEGWPEQVVKLVAHHSGARFEAIERGLSEELAEFDFADSPLLDALVTADLTTGPSGERVSYEDRISEILDRYPAEDPVHRTWVKASPVIAQCVQRTAERASS